jgi:hypothetical protein
VTAAYPGPPITVPVAWLTRPDLAWASPRGGVAMRGQSARVCTHGPARFGMQHGVGSGAIPVHGMTSRQHKVDHFAPDKDGDIDGGDTHRGLWQRNDGGRRQ